jgi:hypothetical protein
MSNPVFSKFKIYASLLAVVFCLSACTNTGTGGGSGSDTGISGGADGGGVIVGGEYINKAGGGKSGSGLGDGDQMSGSSTGNVEQVGIVYMQCTDNPDLESPFRKLCEFVETGFDDSLSDDPICRADLNPDGLIDILDLYNFDKFMDEAASGNIRAACYQSTCVETFDKPIKSCLAVSDIYKLDPNNPFWTDDEAREACVQRYCDLVRCPHDLTDDRIFSPEDRDYISERLGQSCSINSCDQTCQQSNITLATEEQSFTPNVVALGINQYVDHQEIEAHQYDHLEQLRTLAVLETYFSSLESNTTNRFLIHRLQIDYSVTEVIRDSNFYQNQSYTPEGLAFIAEYSPWYVLPPPTDYISCFLANPPPPRMHEGTLSYGDQDVANTSDYLKFLAHVDCLFEDIADLSIVNMVRASWVYHGLRDIIMRLCIPLNLDTSTYSALDSAAATQRACAQSALDAVNLVLAEPVNIDVPLAFTYIESYWTKLETYFGN